MALYSLVTVNHENKLNITKERNKSDHLISVHMNIFFIAKGSNLGTKMHA